MLAPWEFRMLLFHCLWRMGVLPIFGMVTHSFTKEIGGNIAHLFHTLTWFYISVYTVILTLFILLLIAWLQCYNSNLEASRTSVHWWHLSSRNDIGKGLGNATVAVSNGKWPSTIDGQLSHIYIVKHNTMVQLSIYSWCKYKINI
jgi:hypothetical protein